MAKVVMCGVELRKDGERSFIGETDEFLLSVRGGLRRTKRRTLKHIYYTAEVHSWARGKALISVRGGRSPQSAARELEAVVWKLFWPSMEKP